MAQPGVSAQLVLYCWSQEKEKNGLLEDAKLMQIGTESLEVELLNKCKEIKALEQQLEAVKSEKLR